MATINWKFEMDRLIKFIRDQSERSLRIIHQCFQASGHPFDAEFRNYFLGMMKISLDSSFNTIYFERWDENRMRQMASTSSSSIAQRTIGLNSTETNFPQVQNNGFTFDSMSDDADEDIAEKQPKNVTTSVIDQSVVSSASLASANAIEYSKSKQNPANAINSNGMLSFDVDPIDENNELNTQHGSEAVDLTKVHHEQVDKMKMRPKRIAVKRSVCSCCVPQQDFRKKSKPMAQPVTGRSILFTETEVDVNGYIVEEPEIATEETGDINEGLNAHTETDVSPIELDPTDESGVDAVASTSQSDNNKIRPKRNAAKRSPCSCCGTQKNHVKDSETKAQHRFDTEDDAYESIVEEPSNHTAVDHQQGTSSPSLVSAKVIEHSEIENYRSDAQNEIDMASIEIDPIDESGEELGFDAVASTSQSITIKMRPKRNSVKRSACSCCRSQKNHTKMSETKTQHRLPAVNIMSNVKMSRAKVAGPSKKLFKCSRCELKFPKFAHLCVHVTKIHKNMKQQRWYNCTRCLRRFVRKDERRRHEMACENRRYECYLCKVYVSVDKIHMENHMRSHSGDRPFGCSLCGNYFTTKHYLKRHISFHARKQS